MKRLLAVLLFLFCFVKTYPQTWSDVGGGVKGTSTLTRVYTLITDPITNELRVGGIFDTVGGLNISNDKAIWDGNSWSADTTFTSQPIYDMILYNNDLYVGGWNFIKQNGDTIIGIARWNGADWEQLGAGLFGSDSFNYVLVAALEIYNNELYVGGYFATTIGGDTVYSIAKWDGNAWSKAGSGTEKYGDVLTFLTFENKLYAGGAFTTLDDNSISRIAVWDGSAWSSIGSGVNGTGIVLAMAIYNNELLVGGRFLMMGGDTVKHIAKWDGTQWSALGTGLDTIPPTWSLWEYPRVAFNSMVVHKNELYVGGYFHTAGNDTVNHIAKWDGTSWSSIGKGVDTSLWYRWPPEIYSLAVYKDELYVGGNFVVLDDDTMNCIARYDACSYSNPNVSFTQSNDTVDLKDTTTVYFYSSTDTLTKQLLWDFGDGNTDTASNPQHTYDSAGVYTIALTAYNGNCTDTAFSTITVINTTGISDILNPNNSVTIYPNPFSTSATITIKSSASWRRNTKGVSFELYDMLGRTAINNPLTPFSKGEFKFERGNLPSGLYFFQITTDKEIIGTGKLIIQD